jgi:hypothetical protein
VSQRSRDRNQLIVSLFLRQTVGWIGTLLPISCSSAMQSRPPRHGHIPSAATTTPDMRNIFVGPAHPAWWRPAILFPGCW